MHTPQHLVEQHVTGLVQAARAPVCSALLLLARSRCGRLRGHILIPIAAVLLGPRDQLHCTVRLPLAASAALALLVLVSMPTHVVDSVMRTLTSCMGVHVHCRRHHLDRLDATDVGSRGHSVHSTRRCASTCWHCTLLPFACAANTLPSHCLRACHRVQCYVQCIYSVHCRQYVYIVACGHIH